MIGFVLSLLGVYCMIMRDLFQIEKIVLQQCDVEMYLETMKYGVSYGKKLKFKGFQKSLFLMLQQRLATALIADENYRNADDFYGRMGQGKRAVDYISWQL